jgi:hypothetical protein
MDKMPIDFERCKILEDRKWLYKQMTKTKVCRNINNISRACIDVLKNSERYRRKSGRKIVVVRNTDIKKENCFEFSKVKYQSFLNGREKILPH